MLGCGSLTNVDAPDIVQPAALETPLGAETYTNAVLSDLNNGLPAFIQNTAIGSDEMLDAGGAFGNAQNDQRATLRSTFGTFGATDLGFVRQNASRALSLRRRYVPTPASKIGQMFASKGVIELLLGETNCNGTPLSELNPVTYEIIFGGPITSDSMLKRALADFDSALVFATDSARVVNYVRLGRGRTLLDLGRYADAAAAVAPVPTSYVYPVEVTTTTGGVTNSFWNNNSGRSTTVSNREGGNGLDYVTAMDPRVPTTRLTAKGLDGTTDIYLFTKFTGLTSPYVFSSGVEARLIEAEAALNANPNDTQTTGTGWLGILNTLRATQITPPMAPLADPGSFDARVNLLFRERAFWMYGTGHRFGDMRRLLRRYGRAQNTVWPEGAYKGGIAPYGTEVVFGLGASEGTNPVNRSCLNYDP